jgi:hypothetical protein
MKYGHALIIILIVSVGAFLKYDWFRLQHDADKAARAAVPWLFAHQSEITDPGAIWILAKINKDYCGNEPGTEAAIKKMFTPFETNATLLAYRRLLDENFTYTVSTSSLADQTTHFDQILIPALYCDLQPDQIDSTLRKVVALGGESRYQVSHSLLALLWLKERGCLAQDQIKYIDTVAERLYERTAFLQYANIKIRVPQNWLRTIIDNQESSGGWKTEQDAYIFGTNENTHTTALSLFALTQFTHSCPF